MTVRDRDARASVEYLRQAIGWMDSAPATVLENVWYRMDQAEVVASIARPLRKLKRFEEARRYLDRALSTFQALLLKQPSNKMVLAMMTAALLELGALESELGHGPAAENAVREALATNIERVVQANPSNLLLTWRLAQCYEALGGLAERRPNRAVARQWYARSLALWKQWKQAGRPSSGFLETRLRAATAAYERIQ